ncbi:histidine phosphatase family protein [Aeromicrobium camelliae]|uniref:Histidine phosphatase family protein n=1 Tax=Aeromicrobium camelliae TaxID=1538144 RepID=A0A3N6XZY7_9ACTN|nr:histidine phosphatase family protein [Aeromicrobium camelliae]RQN03284.1 histidine phosphatase family protein [Aeromicrobium camelliae]
MSEHAPELWLARHGETEWSKAWRHTSFTDLPLTDVGEQQAAKLRPLLADVAFDRVLSSPRLRARRTAELAGFADPQVDEDLVEWDYGDYEGLTTETIRESVPGWTVWTHPSPGGETAEQLTERLDRVVARVQQGGRTLVFGHGHSLRALTARWLGLGVEHGRSFLLDTGTYSVLGEDRGTPVVTRWNVASW